MTKQAYAHVDMPGHADYVENMITGAAQIDGAVPTQARRLGKRVGPAGYEIRFHQGSAGRVVVPDLCIRPARAGISEVVPGLPDLQSSGRRRQEASA